MKRTKENKSEARERTEYGVSLEDLLAFIMQKATYSPVQEKQEKIDELLRNLLSSHAFLLPTVESVGAKYPWDVGIIEKLTKKLEQVDVRTLKHSSQLEKLEARVESPKKGERAPYIEHEVPQYLSEDFIKLSDHLRNLEEAVGNDSKLLYHLMEAEVVLGELEEKARCTDRKYEARLSASLRDICRLHEPSNISEEQINVFAASNRALMDGWGKLNREKLAWIRSELLKVGLTWLPVTDKAAKEVSKAQSITE